MARYWRISGIQSASNELGLSALALSDGSTDYSTATLTGALSSGFKIIWDLGSDIAITQLKLTSTVQADWPYSLLLESSADGQSYTAAPGVVATIVWPGNATAATVIPAGSGTVAPTVNAASQPSGVTNIADDSMPDSGPVLVASGVVILDTLDGGPDTITGTVKVKALPANTPLHRRVLLMNQGDRRVVYETWSDAVTGDYTFANVRTGVPYTVLAYDYTGTYRAVIADNILATP